MYRSRVYKLLADNNRNKKQSNLQNFLEKTHGILGKAVPEPLRQQFMADYAFSLVVNLLDPKYVPQQQREYYRQFAAL